MSEKHPAEFVDKEALARLRQPGVSLSEGMRRIVLAAIADGRMPRGARLPSIRAMARHCGVAADTVVHTYGRLVTAGHIHAVRGSGFYVAAAVDAVDAQVRGGGAAGTFDLLTGKPLLSADLSPDRLPGAGAVHPAIVSGDHVARILRSSLRTRLDLLCAPGEAEGYRPLRQQIQRKLAGEGVACTAEEIITAAGATGVMNLIVRTFVRPGMTGLVEEPGPFIHRSLLMSQGAMIEWVPREHDGPDIAVLRRLCETHRPRILFCSSAHHNPTGGGISPHKAHQILLLAEEFGLIVVDDASHADLRDPGEEGFWTPLAMLDRLQRVIHVGGFARILGPALGIGYLATSPQMMVALRPFAMVQGRGIGVPAERAIYQLLEDGRFERRRRTVAGQVAAARRSRIALLAHVGLPAADMGFGLYLWTSLGGDRDAVAAAADMRDAGFVLATPDLFSAAPRHLSFTRLNVTTTTDEAIARLIGLE